jgi:hypothetical protein
MKVLGRIALTLLLCLLLPLAVVIDIVGAGDLTSEISRALRRIWRPVSPN